MKCTKEQRLSYTEKAKSLVAQMSLEEKIYLMSGKVNFSPEEIEAMMKDPAKHYNYIPLRLYNCLQPSLSFITLRPNILINSLSHKSSIYVLRVGWTLRIHTYTKQRTLL